MWQTYSVTLLQPTTDGNKNNWRKHCCFSQSICKGRKILYIWHFHLTAGTFNNFLGYYVHKRRVLNDPTKTVDIYKHIKYWCLAWDWDRIELVTKQRSHLPRCCIVKTSINSFSISFSILIQQPFWNEWMHLLDDFPSLVLQEEMEETVVDALKTRGKLCKLCHVSS